MSTRVINRLLHRPIKILNEEERERYKILEPIGHGGMGYVYKARDRRLGKFVAVKTLREGPTEEELQLFQREIKVLASFEHDNIVPILNIGDCEQDGIRKPYLVMPFLEGRTLAQLIEDRETLPVERCLRVIINVCSGLHEAHEREIIHRDIKPSNIFLCANGSVKIIDFGVARVIDLTHTSSLRGTLRYMSPEQLDGRKLDRRSDIFSLGIVLYELLTHRHPFLTPEPLTLEEVSEATQFNKPPLVKAFNADARDSLCYVVQRTLKVDPKCRYQSAQGLADDLEKVLSGEPLDCCNLSKIEPQLAEAAEALAKGRCQQATDVLDLLEGKGYWHPKIEELREQVELAGKQLQLRRWLDQAHEYFSSDKLDLAYKSLDRVRALDPQNAEAETLLQQIVRRDEDRHVERLLESAAANLNNGDFESARQAVQGILAIRVGYAPAVELSREIERKESEFQKHKREEEEFFQKAIRDFKEGNISSANRNVEALLGLCRSDQRADPRYADIYRQVNSAHSFLLRKLDDLEGLRREKKFNEAVALCEEVLQLYPNDIQFKVLLTQSKSQVIEFRSADIAAIVRSANNEPDLDRQIAILEEGLRRHPYEPRLVEAQKSAKESRRVVESIVDRVKDLEREQDFEGAINQYQTLQRMYPQHPGLDFELDRLGRRLQEQLREKARDNLIAEITRCLGEGLLDEALQLCEAAPAEFGGDPKIQQLKSQAQTRIQYKKQAEQLCDESRVCTQSQRHQKAVELLEQAEQLDPKNARVKDLLTESLIVLARNLLSQDWRSAEVPIQKVLRRDPGNKQAKSLYELVQDHRRDEFVSRTMAEARQLQSDELLDQAMAVLESGLGQYRNEPRMTELLKQLRELKDEHDRTKTVARVRGETESLRSEGRMTEAKQRVEEALKEYPADPQLQDIYSAICEAIQESERKDEISRALQAITALENQQTLATLKQAMSLTRDWLKVYHDEPSLLECWHRLERSIDLSTLQVETFHRQAVESLLQRDFDTGLSLIEKCLTIDPEGPKLLRLKRKAQAWRWLARLAQRFTPATTVTVLLVAGIVIAGIVLHNRLADYFWPRFARLSVRSEPSGAYVYLDNERKGVTPADIQIRVRRKHSLKVLVRLHLDEYQDYEESFVLTCDRTFAALIPLKPKPRSPAEDAYDDAVRAYQEGRLVPPEPDNALDHIDKVLQLDPENRLGFNEMAKDLRRRIKTDLAAKLSGLQTKDRNTEVEMKILEDLLIVDPADQDVRTRLNSIPGRIERLKARIEKAIQENRLLTSESGSAFELLKELKDSFPSKETSYCQAKWKLIRSKVGDLLRTKCGTQGDECKAYFASASKDFPHDAELKRIYGNAPTSTFLLPPPCNADCQAKIQGWSSRMEEAYSAQSYVLPQGANTAYYATQIISLATAIGTGPNEREIFNKVERAKDLRAESYRQAEEEARQRSSKNRYIHALDSRAESLRVKEDLEKAEAIDEAIDAFNSGSASHSAAIREIMGRFQDVDSLLSEKHYNVAHLHAFGKECKGVLIVSGYDIRYDSQEAKDSFDKRFDELTDLSQEGEKVVLRLRDRAWSFKPRDEGGKAGNKENVAARICATIKQFKALRQRFRQQNQP
jgi:serine/threonine protein kinase